MKVDFKFKVGQMVKTMFSDIGTIDMAAIDDSNTNKYYVKRSSESQWFKESQLSEKEENEQE